MKIDGPPPATLPNRPLAEELVKVEGPVEARTRRLSVLHPQDAPVPGSSPDGSNGTVTDVYAFDLWSHRSGFGLRISRLGGQPHRSWKAVQLATSYARHIVEDVQSRRVSQMNGIGFSARAAPQPLVRSRIRTLLLCKRTRLSASILRRMTLWPMGSPRSSGTSRPFLR